MKNLLPLFLSIFLFFGCSKNQSETNSTGSDQSTAEVKQVDAAQFRKLTESPNALVLDVRTAEEVAEGHLPNSVNIDIYSSDFMAKVQELPKDKEILVYCKVGGRSQQAAEILSKQGFAQVYNLDGGIVAWQGSGFEVVK